MASSKDFEPLNREPKVSVITANLLQDAFAASELGKFYYIIPNAALISVEAVSLQG